MDADMWEHDATQTNVTRLRELGYTVLDPEEGKLASGLVGPGRLPEIVDIVRAVERIVDGAHQDLKDKSILISAGPTHEPIDPVRFLGNRSSGKMGFALANAAALRGADVTIVAGPTHLGTPRFVRRIDVETAAEMSAVIKEEFTHADALIMAAAVADFTPSKSKDKKIRKEEMHAGAWELKLETTEDILKSLAGIKGKKVKVGFALETGSGVKNAQKKLKEKKLDLIVLNDLRDEGAGFGVDTNVVTIFAKSGKKEKLPKMAKFDVANAILDRLKRLLPK
jgi:phosphopantothenoylcysteine decarboxylase/phosphopantothenate--cysteine ligase